MTLLHRIGLGALGVLGALLLLWAYGSARYRAGVKDTEAGYKAAEAALLARSVGAASAADRQAAEAGAKYAKAVAEERSKVDEAVAAGDSPLDGLFN